MKWFALVLSWVAVLASIYLTGKHNDLAMLALGWAIYSKQDAIYLSQTE